jgi:alanyl-tRNA synthetase
MQKSPEYLLACAHTAEHAFVGSLQKLAGHTLSVVKVDHRDKINTVFIRKVPNIDRKLIIQAQEDVNRLINTGRRVISHTFSSLSEAKERFPTLRVNEERINERDQVRVVEIEDHDLAACAKEHVTNLTECDFVLVTRISESSNVFEIDFKVGLQAKEFAICNSLKLLNICSEIGANINSVENTVKKLKNENEKLLRNLKTHSRKNLDKISPYAVENNRITIIQGVFTDLIDSEIRMFADRKILNDNTVVIIANAHNDDSDEASNPTAHIFLARSDVLKDIDCNKIVKEIASIEGRGGGKPHFATGVIKKDDMTDIVKNVVTLVKKKYEQMQ